MSTPLPPGADYNRATNPADFLSAWSASRGNLRRFFEDTALPPIDDTTQKAAAEAAVAEAFGLDPADFDSGISSVSGAFEAAGNRTVTPPNPDIAQDPSAAAFFDIDNTLIQGASLTVFAMGLARKRYITLSHILPAALQQLKFRLTGAENSDDMAKGRQRALEFIRGRSVAELVEVCEEIVDTHMEDRIWPGTKELADRHLQAGQQVWLVSATPVQLAQILARRLGFTGALGTVAEEENGVFTGRLVGDILHGPGKRHAVAALAAVERLDLSRCTAYSDSYNDVPMLSMVGTAVAVNPDRNLRRKAAYEGWEVRDYRNVRKAIRSFGLPAILAAAFSTGLWRAYRWVAPHHRGFLR